MNVEGPCPILFVHHALSHPEVKWVRGPTRCLRDLLTHLDRQRFEPIVLCNEPAIAELEATGVAVHRAPDWTASRGRFSPWWIREVARIVRQHRIRVIHVDEYMQNATVVPVARTLRVPLVTQLHRVPSAEERRWALLHQTDHAVGVSQASLDGLLADGFPRERTEVIYNPVDPRRLAIGDATALRRQLGIGPRDIVVAMVAYLVPWKAIDVALHAFRAVRESRSDCHLIVCGDGPDRRSLEAQADSLGLRRVTHFLGDRSDVGAILRDAVDILISTSRRESFNLTLAEAGVFGVPAVASDIPAHREVLDDGTAGWLVAPDDVRGFADALTALAADPALRTSYGASLRRRVEGSFLVGEHVRAFETLYARLIARPPASSGWLRATTWPRLYTDWIRERLGAPLRVLRAVGPRRAARGESRSGEPVRAVPPAPGSPRA